MFSICLFSLLQESCLQWKVKTIIIFIRDSTSICTFNWPWNIINMFITENKNNYYVLNG